VSELAALFLNLDDVVGKRYMNLVMIFGPRRHPFSTYDPMYGGISGPNVLDELRGILHRLTASQHPRLHATSWVSLMNLG